MSEKEIPQAGSGVCIRCFMSVADLEKHDWEEHRIGERPEIVAKDSGVWDEYRASFVWVGDKPDNRSGK